MYLRRRIAELWIAMRRLMLQIEMKERLSVPDSIAERRRKLWSVQVENGIVPRVDWGQRMIVRAVAAAYHAGRFCIVGKLFVRETQSWQLRGE